MKLLERDTFLTRLSSIHKEVADSGGHIVLVTGEAGIGKSSFVETFIEEHSHVQQYIGYCDALFGPSLFGAFYDIAYKIGGRLLELYRGGANINEIFGLFFEELKKKESQVILVLEDVHWADEATLDLVKFLGRRISKTRVLFILTYRDDEIGELHPLRRVIGELPSNRISRISLPPLSVSAVKELMGNYSVHEATRITNLANGNPFFVTELAANIEKGYSQNIDDAIWAKLSKLCTEARELVEVISLNPGRLELWMLEKLYPNFSNLVEEGLNLGLLRCSNDRIYFKHEITRLIVEKNVPPIRKKILHHRILNLLIENREKVALCRILHHAIGADDSKAMLKYATLAAQFDIDWGAHSDATKNLAIALQFSEELDDEQQAVLHEKYAYECYLTNQVSEAIRSRMKALELWENQKNEIKAAHNLRWLSRLKWFDGKYSEAESYGKAAVEILENITQDNQELGRAYSNLSQLMMLVSAREECIIWGKKAIEIAEKINDRNLLAHTLNNIGTAELEGDFSENGESKLLKSLDIALDEGFQEDAARAYSNLGSMSVIHCKYDKANNYLDKGIGYCLKHDLGSWKVYMQSWLLRIYVEQDHWAEALKLSGEIMRSNPLSIITKINVLTQLACLNVRSGNSNEDTQISEALELAKQTKEINRIIPVLLVKLEYIWIKDETENIDPIVDYSLNIVSKCTNKRQANALAYWIWRIKHEEKYVKENDDPYYFSVTGKWETAAHMWHELSRNYDEALSLFDGDEAAFRKGLSIAEDLAAKPLIQKFLVTMRERGMKKSPIGPRKSTAKNPMHLTNRQLDVLNLMTVGLSNKEIADKLFISAKTVDHHISEVLSKLGVNSRQKAAMKAESLGLIQKS